MRAARVAISATAPSFGGVEVRAISPLIFDQACVAQSVKPAITLQASAADAIADLATRGLAVAILSDSMAARYRDRLTALAIDDVKTPVLLALVWRTAHSPAVRELLVHSRRAFAKPAPGKNQPAETELPI